MLGKTFGYVIGTVILVVFGLIAYWTPLTEGMVTANATYAAAGNYTETVQMIRFTPLALWIGILATPLVVILLIVWQRRQIS